MSVRGFFSRFSGPIRRIVYSIGHPKPSKTFVRLGTEYGGWWIEPRGLGPDSHIISAGVGEDASFDLALISTIGCSVIALDPTPKARSYVLREIREARFRYRPFALAARDGSITLTPPSSPEYASWSLASAGNTQDSCEFSATSLRTILHEEQWTHFDLVKMDVEGAEYEVIDSIICDGIPLHQLCVEFHDDAASPRACSKELITKRLDEYGLRLVYQEGPNYTFVKTAIVSA